MSAEALICSFRHVMLGQQIFPTKLMMSMMGDGAEPAHGAAAGLHGNGLTVLGGDHLHRVFGRSARAVQYGHTRAFAGQKNGCRASVADCFAWCLAAANDERHLACYPTRHGAPCYW